MSGARRPALASKGMTMAAEIQTGLEHLMEDPPAWLQGRRLGLLCNPASVDRHLRHASKLIARRFPGQLAALYSPQHGFHAEKQDNMIESDDMRDPVLKVPVFSLYGRTRRPTRAMLEPIEVLLVDLQDVGTRVYTFIYTLSFCLEAAASCRKKVLVLDRPNPIGGLQTEGNCLQDEYRSFVGRYPIPMRHGLTIAEMALMMNRHFGIGCDLAVVTMQNWHRALFFADTGLPWVAPSPNLPTAASAIVYPGQVLWEGTNVSEGRGTTQPFELFGAPALDPEKIISSMGGRELPGAILRPTAFEPTSNKWQGTRCYGFQIHVIDAHAYQPYQTSLRLLQAVISCHGDWFEWKKPPYEYEFEKSPIDLIIGDRCVRERLERLEPVESIAASWQNDLEVFNAVRRPYLLYE
jgi:uncharacterized protein YbbC (DUF1343 family)